MFELAASLSKEDGLVLGELGSVLIGLGIAALIATRIRLSVVPIFLLAGLFFGEGGIFALELSDEFLDLGANGERYFFYFSLAWNIPLKNCLTLLKHDAHSVLSIFF